MITIEPEIQPEIKDLLAEFKFDEKSDLFNESTATKIEEKVIDSIEVKKFINEFWTSKQRQANSIHEISYRACFKPQLPNFFIKNLTNVGDIVYDPFSGRGTTVIEAALLERNIIANDINPISQILCKPRLFIPDITELKQRLNEIPIDNNVVSNIDLSMFFHEKTLKELLSLRQYLIEKEKSGEEDKIDSWIRMVATNRLTGHSKGFFSVYSLPPNQAVRPERQLKINLQRNQTPEYRNTKEIIISKTKSLTKDLSREKILNLRKVGSNAIFLNTDSRETKSISDESISLTVTSPPFLDIVQYNEDNWMRCWFNNIDSDEIAKKITMSKKLKDWVEIMMSVFAELFRITKRDKYVAFEVGEIRNGKIKLDEHIVKIGTEQGFTCEGIMINQQEFTKTSNIWGISNNGKGTNTNRIVIFKK